MAEWTRPGHWTYLGDPDGNDRDHVRFLAGDTNPNDPLVSDEEIAHAYAAEGTHISAAARVLEYLAAQFAREASKTVGAGGGLNTSISLDQRSKAFGDQAKRLRAQAAFAVAPYAGGISIADKDTVQSDTDRVKPAFKVGMFDNP